MRYLGDRLDRLLLTCLPAVIILGGGICLLPRELLVRATGVLTVWLTMSVPIGIVVGHCALGEAEAR
jgi:hypothetical protein